jgi:hypothetical protein
VHHSKFCSAVCNSLILGSRRSVSRSEYLDSAVKNAYTIYKINLFPTVINFIILKMFYLRRRVLHVKPKVCSCGTFCHRPVLSSCGCGCECEVAVTVDSGVQSSRFSGYGQSQQAVICMHIRCVAVDHCRHVLRER